VNKVEALRKSTLLGGVDEARLEALAAITRERSLEVDETLIRAGDKGAMAMFIVLEGMVEVRREGLPLSRLGPGNHFGEMALLTSGDSPRSADVVAVEPTRVLQLTSWDLFPFLDANPEVARAIIGELARRLVLADERLIAILGGQEA
jgi:CRP/FNR family cyclic AMP-dependent transcriptional regulator